jgi:hypothetical protein
MGHRPVAGRSRAALLDQNHLCAVACNGTHSLDTLRRPVVAHDDLEAIARIGLGRERVQANLQGREIVVVRNDDRNLRRRINHRFRSVPHLRPRPARTPG